MPLLAILLVAAAPGQDVVQLTSKTQLKELCLDPAQIAEARKAAQARREEAAGRWYRVEVSSKGFAFGRYRAQDQQLELDGDRPLRAIDDMLSLDLDGIDDVSFAGSSEQVTAWTQEKKAKALKLVVVWKPSGARCAGSAAAEAWRIAGHARSWELLGAQGTLATANEEGDPVGAGPRQMRVEKVALDTDDAPLENEGRSRLASSQAALDRCAAGAVRTGRLVMSFSVHDGRVREPQVIMDSLRDEKVAGCVARAISGTELAGTGHGTASLTVQ